MPSPDHRDDVPLLLELGHLGGLVGRQHVGEDVGDADPAATAWAVAALSPVIIQTSSPSAWSCAMASADSGLTVSATATRAASSSSTATYIGVSPRPAAAAAAAASAPTSTPARSIMARLPIRTRRPSTVCVEPVAGHGVEPVQRRQGECRLAGVGDDGLADGVLAAGLGGGDQGAAPRARPGPRRS